MDKVPNTTTPPVNPDDLYYYRCVEKCTYNGIFWKVGESLVLTEKKKIPHFELAE